MNPDSIVNEEDKHVIPCTFADERRVQLEDVPLKRLKAFYVTLNGNVVGDVYLGKYARRVQRQVSVHRYEVQQYQKANRCLISSSLDFAFTGPSGCRGVYASDPPTRRSGAIDTTLAHLHTVAASIQLTSCC